MRSYQKNILPLNTAQGEYLQALTHFPISVGTGSAGSGKTYLAVYRACKDFDKNRYDKIILVRPVVATEQIGYLPGDMQEKLDPYLRPLFDVFHERWGIKKTNGYLESGEIEIAPLAFMRGRTFHNSFVILDEAQNSTVDQMVMFLTRMGDNAKYVITGDPSQSDICGINGLAHINEKLKNCDIVKIVKFGNDDIVRSSVMKELMKYLD